MGWAGGRVEGWALRRAAGVFAVALILAWAPFAPPAGAQELRAQLLTIDSDRLFSDTIFGVRLAQEIEEAAAALNAENTRIEQELTAEELALTEERPTLEAEAFRAKANAFDEKVQRIRNEQDTKARAIQDMQTNARQTFIAEISPILSTIAVERGAVAIIERRQVFLAADGIDITVEAIRRINAALGTGAEAEEEAGGAAGAGDDTAPAQAQQPTDPAPEQ